MTRWLMSFTVAGAALLMLAPQQGRAQQAAKGNTAQVTVQVPSATAELWFNGVSMPSAGTTRTFTTPKLAQGQDFHYTVRARWRQNGLLVDATHNVDVSAGQRARVDFRDALRRASVFVYVPVYVREYVPEFVSAPPSSNRQPSSQWVQPDYPEP